VKGRHATPAIACLPAGAVGCGGAVHPAGRGATVHICDDDAEWPPYLYYQRQDGRKGAPVRGYSADVVAAIFARHGTAYSIELLPWKRCLQELRVGTRYQMLLSASSNPEREAEFLLSRPYYTTHDHYFYSRRAHPHGLALRRPADLNRYALGGISGYANSQLEGVDKTAMIRTGNYVALVNMLRLGRGEVFAEDIEVIDGMSRLGIRDFADTADLAHAPLPETAPNTFHMMFSKSAPLGSALKDLIDGELAAMEKSGELRRLLARNQQ